MYVICLSDWLWSTRLTWNFEFWNIDGDQKKKVNKSNKDYWSTLFKLEVSTSIPDLTNGFTSFNLKVSSLESLRSLFERNDQSNYQTKDKLSQRHWATKSSNLFACIQSRPFRRSSYRKLTVAHSLISTHPNDIEICWRSFERHTNTRKRRWSVIAFKFLSFSDQFRSKKSTSFTSFL